MNGTRILILVLILFGVFPNATVIWLAGGNAPPYPPGVMFLMAVLGLFAVPALAFIRSWTDASKPPEDSVTDTPQTIVRNLPPH